MNCVGCGKNIGPYRLPVTEISQEFCGECNQKYYDWLEEQRERQASWDKLVAKYGYEIACEIIADLGY